MENKIQSFATFSETRKAAMETKLKEEATTKRTSEAQRFADLLAEYEVSTVAEIAEEQRTEFFAKLVGETDEVETEGNAFGAAVKDAKEKGEDEFTVGGETYKVKESVEEGELSEGVHPKIKKAMKAVEKGKVAYGENIRFPGRFKIIKFSMDGAMALVDYQNGQEPYEIPAMNIALDKLKIESVVIEEAKVEEADVKSAEDFKEYAFAILKKAHGDDFDEAKAQEVVDGILDKCGDDYGACVGTLQSSLS